MKQIKDIDELFALLGGTRAVAEKLGVKVQTVHGMRFRGKLSSRHLFAVTHALPSGYDIPGHLFYTRKAQRG